METTKGGHDGGFNSIIRPSGESWGISSPVIAEEDRRTTRFPGVGGRVCDDCGEAGEFYFFRVLAADVVV